MKRLVEIVGIVLVTFILFHLVCMLGALLMVAIMAIPAWVSVMGTILSSLLILGVRMETKE
jgi:hypothetical protein